MVKKLKLIYKMDVTRIILWLLATLNTYILL